jgi:Uma2 family endonuclease
MEATTLVAPVEEVERNGALQPHTAVNLLPDHTQLPEEDGSIVQNFQEHPQSILLTDSIWSTLQEHHPDQQFAVGQDCGIYWRLTEPRERGATAPDWFYVPNVPPLLDGRVRRSYVLWQEFKAPLIVIEFVSDTDSREWDRTPYVGKFWIYENAIRPAYYAIYERDQAKVTVFRLVDLKFQPVAANERGHYPIEPLGVELGIWSGNYLNFDLPWLRWWDDEGQLLPTSEERMKREAERAEREAERAELAAKLRALGIDPDEVNAK